MYRSLAKHAYDCCSNLQPDCLALRMTSKDADRLCRLPLTWFSHLLRGSRDKQVSPSTLAVLLQRYIDRAVDLRARLSTEDSNHDAGQSTSSGSRDGERDVNDGCETQVGNGIKESGIKRQVNNTHDFDQRDDASSNVFLAQVQPGKHLFPFVVFFHSFIHSSIYSSVNSITTNQQAQQSRETSAVALHFVRWLVDYYPFLSS